MRLTAGAILVLCVWLGGCFEGTPRRHVSAAEQRTLPTDEFALGDSLCPAKYVPGSLADGWRMRAIREYRALRIALMRHPDYLVTAHYELSDPEGDQDQNQTEELTVVQLAETDIRVIDSPPSDADNSVEGRTPISCRERMRTTLIRLIGPDRAVTTPY
jgi:hypothetical protein